MHHPQKLSIGEMCSPHPRMSNVVRAMLRQSDGRSLALEPMVRGSDLKPSSGGGAVAGPAFARTRPHELQLSTRVAHDDGGAWRSFVLNVLVTAVIACVPSISDEGRGGGTRTADSNLRKRIFDCLADFRRRSFVR